MDWIVAKRGFQAYLLLERSLSANTIEAYLDDVRKLLVFFHEKKPNLEAKDLSYQTLLEFTEWLAPQGLGARSQARILSGIRAFFHYLLLENLIDTDPTEMLEGPKIPHKMPTVLSLAEVEAVLNAIDLSEDLGQRNRAMIETLYACGLRVSELTGLRISNVFFNESFIKVTGKNDKERLVPIGASALKHIRLYLEGVRRPLLQIQKGHEDFLFLNRFGRRISRVSVFNIIKTAVEAAGITKTVSPHTFRHSFATHLVAGGADLRAVQDMLGHESITTTEIYAHLDTSFLRETVLAYHPLNRFK